MIKLNQALVRRKWNISVMCATLIVVLSVFLLTDAAVGGQEDAASDYAEPPTIEATDYAEEILQEAAIADVAPLWPIQDSFLITSEFGTRRNPLDGTMVFHKGIDIPAREGTPILAVNKGVIIEAEYSDEDGLYLIVDHGEGQHTFYAHMSSYAVTIGDLVDRGDVIGYVGSTGAATKSHLHFSLIVDANYVDPRDIY